MIINKVTPFWTEEQQKKFNELTDQYNSLFDTTPTDKTTDIWATAREIDAQRNEIIRAIGDSYIKSFARRKSAVFDDIKEIVDAITKEDYLNAVKYDAFTVVSSREPLDDYQKCYYFIDTQLMMQYRVIVKYDLSRARMKQIIDDKVSQWYVNKHPDFIPTVSGVVTDELARITPRDIEVNSITGTGIVKRDNFNLSIEDYQNLQGKLGVRTHKLLTYSVGQFTRINSRNTRQSTNLQVSFEIKDYARLLGKDVDPHPDADPEQEEKRIRRQLNEVQKDIAKSLAVLYAYSLSWEESIKGKQTAFADIRILGAKGITRRGTVIMEFSGAMGNYLKSLPITQFPVTQYRIDGRNPNAYSMGNKIAYHHYMDSNQKRGTSDRLKVERLLEACTEIPTIQRVTEQQASWQGKIKEPFENALEAIRQAGTIKDWHYTHAKGVELTEEEARNITDYNTFKELYVTFVIGVEVDNTERFNRQEERKEKKKPSRKKKKVSQKKG